MSNLADNNHNNKNDSLSNSNHEKQSVDLVSLSGSVEDNQSSKRTTKFALDEAFKSLAAGSPDQPKKTNSRVKYMHMANIMLELSSQLLIPGRDRAFSQGVEISESRLES